MTRFSTIEADCNVCTIEHRVLTLYDSQAAEPSTTSSEENLVSTSGECAPYTTFTTTVLGSFYLVESSLPGCTDDKTFSARSISSSIEFYETDSGEDFTSINPTINTFQKSSIHSTLATSTTSSYSDSSISTSSAPRVANIGADSSCKKDGTEILTLKDSILKDFSNRIGSIVANRQFQFDGPTPQAGAIIAVG